MYPVWQFSDSEAYIEPKYEHFDRNKSAFLMKKDAKGSDSKKKLLVEYQIFKNVNEASSNNSDKMLTKREEIQECIKDKQCVAKEIQEWDPNMFIYAQMIRTAWKNNTEYIACKVSLYVPQERE